MQTISTYKLQNGEYIGFAALEVVSVPHMSIIGDVRMSQGVVIKQYSAETSGFLTELFQVQKNASPMTDTSVELLWITHGVNNQPFRASIRMFLVFRAINRDANRAMKTAEEQATLCKSMLLSQKYEYVDVSEAFLEELVERIDVSNIRAITKEERLENLQNQIIPFCYAYDRIPPVRNDLSRIVSVLTEYPDCAVSFQLIPTSYQSAEAAEIDKTTQLLGTLNRGITDQGIGNVSFALAARHAETYKYYSESKRSALFGFNIVVFGNSQAVLAISNRVLSQISTSETGTANFQIIPLSTRDVQINNYYSFPWVVSENVINKGRNQQLWSSRQLSTALYRLPTIITAEEAVSFFRLPIGSDSVSAGLKVNEASMTSRTYGGGIINSGDITVGRLRSSGKGDTIGFSLKDLAKHMLIVGTPGSGKTTFSVSLLDRLWKEHHIPFLVIEPAKNEYRALIQSIPDLQVFTPGKNFISPFVFNPFIPPKNVKLETYKSTLKTAFAAAVSMSTPLDKIFEESVNNCYSDFRWLDTYTVEDKGQIFNIADFIKCFQQTFDEIGYTGDAKNIGRAGVVRLNSLANLFDNYHSIPIEDLLQKPTIIELAAIENSDQKALIIALLLLSILAYVNANYVGEGGLRNVILLEEAHVLLDASTNAGQGDANPSAIAQGLVKRMLAEIRSYGVGLIIADQSPRKVTTDVVALTDMKMAFRLVESVDKQIIGDSTNMADAQVQRLAKLKPGEAFLFYSKLDEPEEVITPDYRLENNISITLSDEGIRQLTTYWRGKEPFLRPYPQCKYCKHCQTGCDYSRRILAREIARRIFVKHFKAGDKDFNSVIEVFKRISSSVISELNDEPFSEELLLCVKLHLWRRIRYGTRIPIKEVQIINSLKK